MPHMCDESFGGNLSGVAISLISSGDLEQICADEGAEVQRKGLQRRIELITNILNIKGGTIMITEDIAPKFRRNRPQNDLETDTDRQRMLAGLTFPRRPGCSCCHGVENVQDELRKAGGRKEPRMQDDFGSL